MPAFPPRPQPNVKYSEIEILVRARYPLIYVVSWEEDRVVREIDAIGRRLGKQIFTWTVNEGIQMVADELMPQTEAKRGTKDPLKAIQDILEQSEPAIYVLKDFHAFIKEAAIARGLRTLAERLRSSYISIVLLSPVLEIPPELEKEVTVVDYPLPATADIAELLADIEQEVSGNVNLTVDLKNGAKEEIIRAAIGLTLSEAENVFAKTLVMTGCLTSESVPLIFSEKRQIIRKSGMLEYVNLHEDIHNVGGLGVMKDWLAKRRLAFTDEAEAFGLQPPKGCLVIGVQGCGKSLCAKAIPTMWKVPLLRLDMGRLFGSFVGSSEQNVRRAIQIAESVQPVVLWIDEIDKGFSGLESSSFSDSGTAARVFGTVLTWLQEKTSSVFVIATANNVNVLPPELLRKGRFDETFFVDLPNEEERNNIFRIHIAKRRRDPKNYDVSAFVRASVGFSGAEIEQAVVSALFEAFAERTELGSNHILMALTETVPLSRLMERQITELRQWAKGRTRPAS
jgi:SpoVK/Ycf46/Vps4 family AAA+-type ATPase